MAGALVYKFNILSLTSSLCGCTQILITYNLLAGCIKRNYKHQKIGIKL